MVELECVWETLRVPKINPFCFKLSSLFSDRAITKQSEQNISLLLTRVFYKSASCLDTSLLTSLQALTDACYLKWDVSDLFLTGCISRYFFCFLPNPLQLIHLPLETQCARLGPSQSEVAAEEFLHMSYMWHSCSYTLEMLVFRNRMTLWTWVQFVIHSNLQFFSTVLLYRHHGALIVPVIIYLCGTVNKSGCGVQQWLCCSSQLPQTGDTQGSSLLAPTTLPSKFPGRALNQVRALGPWQAKPHHSLP